MDPIPFTKMSGSGNDFVVVDNRDGIVAFENQSRFAEHICCRRLSVGADGLILIERSEAFDFKWKFFNSDGSIAEMCGNGARCAARFAFINGITKESMCFETIAGIINAQVFNDQVKVGMTEPYDLVIDAVLSTGTTTQYCSINTGVPHVVIGVNDINSINVVDLGRKIRNHRQFAPAGTNVNFLEVRSDGFGMVRTYERGVEDETLACGTGIVACALILAAKSDVKAPVILRTKSNSDLKVHFSKKGNRFAEIFLEGDARIIYEGRLMPDAWLYDKQAQTI